MTRETRLGQVLDEQTHFLINNLIVDETLLAAVLRDGVFSGQMLDKIRACITPAEKASSLVDLLKRRGIEAFDKFLQILTETHHKHVSDHLLDCLSQRPTTRCSTRPGTAAMGSRSQFSVEPISIVVSSYSDQSDDEHTARSSPIITNGGGPGNNRVDLRSLDKEELVEIIRRRNETIDRLERDYRELNADCELALKDLQESDETNQRLFSENTLLRQLVAQEQFVPNGNGAVSMTTIVDLKQQIAERTERVRETERRLEKTRDKLSTVESSLRRAADTRRKIARELHLDDDATDADLLLKLKDMKQSSDKDRQRAADVERQLSGLRMEMSTLEDEKGALERQCVQLSFRVRQLNHQVMSQSRRAEKFAGNVQPAPQVSDRQMHGMAQIQLTIPDSKSIRPITTHRSDSALTSGCSQPTALLPLRHRNPAFCQYTERRSVTQHPHVSEQRLPAIDRTRLRYCVLCRSDFILPGNDRETAPAAKSSSNQACRVHRQGVVDGSYECCGDATDWKPGCVTVKYHVYVERDSATGKIFLTDGVKRLVDAK